MKREVVGDVAAGGKGLDVDWDVVRWQDVVCLGERSWISAHVPHRPCQRVPYFRYHRRALHAL